MDRFRFRNLTSRDRLASKVPTSLQGKKQSQRSSRSSSSEYNSCHCEALSENKLQPHQSSTGVPMKSLLAQEMSKQKESKKRSPSIIARLMGLDVLPPQSSSSHRQHKSVENQQGRSGGGSSTSYDGNKSLRRSSKGEQKFKDVFEVMDAKKAESNRNLYHQGRVNAANLTQAEMAFIRQKFMEAKRLSTDERFRNSKEFNDALEALDSNKDLLLKFLQHPDSLFTKHLHDLQSVPHKPQYSQAPSLKSPQNSQRHVDGLKTQKVDRDLLRKSQRSPHQHGGGSGCSSRCHTRHVSYDTLDLPIEELGKTSESQPTKIVVLKPNLGEPRYAGRTFASPSSSSDEFRADRRLPCTSNHGRQKSYEDIRHSRQNSRDSGESSKIMSRQRKASCGNGSAMSFETSGFRGYAGDESSSGSDSASETELVPVTSRTRAAFNRKNYHRSLHSKSTTSSVSREAKRRLSERWKLTHKFEQEIEISRSGTLAEMLATSDREARPASFNGLIFEEGISKRVESNLQWSELQEPVGISSRDGWKGSWSRKFSKSKTIMNQESTSGYTIVLPKLLIDRDELVKGNSSHHVESYLSSKSRPGSNKSHSSYNSSPEVNISPSLCKFLYTNDEIRKEKLSPSKARSSFSVDANSDTEDDSTSDDIKTAMSSEAPDLSTVTTLTDPDISRIPTEDVSHSSVSVPEPQSRETSKEGDQPSPVSVLEASFDDDASSTSECFESVSADLQGLRMQLQLLKLESAAYNEGAMLLSSDDDTDQEESSTITDETVITREVGEEDWKTLYLVDLLANSSFGDSDHNTVMETPVDPSLFQDLEKKYSRLKTSTRLERKFLFDQISRELIQMLKQFSDPHPWIKSTRMVPKWDTNMIQEKLRDLVTRKDEKPSKDDDVEEKELQWLSLEDDTEIIGRDIEEMLTDELLAELVLDAIF